MNKRLRLALMLGIGLSLVLACRTTELISDEVNQVEPTRESLQITATATRHPPIHSPTPEQPTETPTLEPTLRQPTFPPPTPIPPSPLPPPTHKPVAPPKPNPTATPTEAGPTLTPAPTRCPQLYCVVYHGCQAESGNTIIEGVVYNNGEPEDGVAVRVAKSPGAYPLVDDFKSGTSPVNPGQPDLKHPGHYILQVVAGAARQGDWWVFVVDKPNGTRELSEPKLIQTQDDPNAPGSCQHAFVDFVR